MPEEFAIETAAFPRAEVTKDYPDVTTGRELADAITTRMVLKPKTLDILNPLIVS
jgi:isocitrate/isopropylmalate dehydrogenase